METIRSNITFDRESYQYGVLVNMHHSDNGIVNSENFIQKLLNSDHNKYFSGIISPQNNSVAEGAINI